MSVSANDSMHKPMANAVRALSMDAVQKANSGHPGMPMGMADVATVLFRHYLRFDPKNPTWADRDRFILSAGHGSMLQYSLAYLTGNKKITMEEIKNFRQWGSHTAGHPERDLESGIEMTTGPLGQGISTAVGFALGERVMNGRFGDDLVDHHTYVIASDGDLMEGISHEAASLAGHMKLGRLVVYYDDNSISIDGGTELSFTEDVQARFRAYGWQTLEVDGHDPQAIAAATDSALAETKRPTLIACKTIIGFGAPTKQGTSGCHGAPLGEEEIAAARKVLGWTAAPFEIPTDILNAWRGVSERSAANKSTWDSRLEKSADKETFLRVMAGDLPSGVNDALVALKKTVAAEKPKRATRQSSGDVLNAIADKMPELIGGSADLSPSNNTQAKSMKVISAPFYAGQYVHYGVREHGMAAIMNGMTLHGGMVPYGGTFMQFADYCRPSIRLAALMGTRSIFIMTHDSIGLGEDGPTHQPVEHMAALRAIPNLMSFRPADGVETAECWQLSLNAKATPSLLALSRQGLPTVRTDVTEENKSARGAYVLSDCDGDRAVTLLASGSEVMLAMEAQEELKKDGINAAVVSVPCTTLFDEQDDAYRSEVLGSAPRVAVEAGIRMGWDRYIGDNGIFIGMKSFGASAPAPELYKQFGITTDAVVAAAKKLVK